MTTNPTGQQDEDCKDCRTISVSDGHGGGDGEVIPCERHTAYVDLAVIRANGWPATETDPWA